LTLTSDLDFQSPASLGLGGSKHRVKQTHGQTDTSDCSTLTRSAIDAVAVELDTRSGLTLTLTL